MRTFHGSAVPLLAFVLFFGFPLMKATSCLAEESAGLAGWERSGDYDRRYNPSELDELKGIVEDVSEITPLPAMAPGIGMTVRDQDGDSVNVQLGPKAFVKLDAVGIHKGDKVKVKGVWTDIGGKEVFIASKVKKGESTELKLRKTKEGTPFWTLSPEELAKEKEQ